MPSGPERAGPLLFTGRSLSLVGFLSAGNVSAAAAIFPKPVLGVILLFEGISLLNLMRDMAPLKNNFVITVLVALAAVCLPYGYLIGMAAGTALYYLHERRIIGIADPIPVGR